MAMTIQQNQFYDKTISFIHDIHEGLSVGQWCSRIGVLVGNAGVDVDGTLVFDLKRFVQPRRSLILCDMEYGTFLPCCRSFGLGSRNCPHGAGTLLRDMFKQWVARCNYQCRSCRRNGTWFPQVRVTLDKCTQPLVSRVSRLVDYGQIVSCGSKRLKYPCEEYSGSIATGFASDLLLQHVDC